MRRKLEVVAAVKARVAPRMERVPRFAWRVTRFVDRMDVTIACDAASRSELVVPIVAEGALIGVLDLDSPLPNRFDDEDVAGCTELIRRVSARLAGMAKVPA